MRIQASAPGKVILLGEHAVVYGRPAIAVPLSGLRATVTVEPGEPGAGVVILAQDLGRTLHAEQEPSDPLVVTVRNTLARLGVDHAGDLRLTIASAIPVASGLGSGAAVAVATIRALDARFHGGLTDADVSALAYETEVLHHGTPSGIDNSVVAYERPIVFTKARGVEPFSLGQPLTLVVGDTGIASPTRETVGDVRRAWQADPTRYEALFDAIAATVQAGRAAIERGDATALGAAMRRDHMLLQELGVSCAELDALVAAAEGAGALGAKLAGGGRGGHMIALVTRESAAGVAAALAAAGARHTLVSEIV